MSTPYGLYVDSTTPTTDRTDSPTPRAARSPGMSPAQARRQGTTSTAVRYFTLDRDTPQTHATPNSGLRRLRSAPNGGDSTHLTAHTRTPDRNRTSDRSPTTPHLTARPRDRRCAAFQHVSSFATTLPLDGSTQNSRFGRFATIDQARVWHPLTYAKERGDNTTCMPRHLTYTYTCLSPCTLIHTSQWYKLHLHGLHSDVRGSAAGGIWTVSRQVSPPPLRAPQSFGSNLDRTRT